MPEFITALDIRLSVSSVSVDSEFIRECVLTALLNSCPDGWALEVGGPVVHLEDVDVFSVTRSTPNPD